MTEHRDYVENARKQRETTNVLRLRVLQIQSGYPDATIFVFEGVNDIGPYEVWFRILANVPQYIPLPGSGKVQILDFAKQVLDSEDFHCSLYFFVDHDFDGLQGRDPHPKIFCTSAYSVENYLCTSEVLESILIDEFRLAGRQAVINQVLELFGHVTEQYCQYMRGVNLRLFCGKLHALGNGNVDNKIRKYLNIEYCSIETNLATDMSSLIPLKREPTSEELAGAECFFHDQEKFLITGRGKLLLEFFFVWLEKIEEAFRNKSLLPLDGFDIKSKLHRNELSLRNLATRATPPIELKEFVHTHFSES